MLADYSSEIINPVVNPQVGSGSGTDILQLFLNNFITIAFIIGSVIFFYMLLTGGIEYITSGGDKDATQKASKRITHALIGLAILLGSYAILLLVGEIFGINLILLNIPVIK